MSRRVDSIEAVANSVVGLAVSVAAVQAVWPLMGWPVTGGQSVAVSLLFFALSTGRAYLLRRLFRGIDNG